MPVRTPILPPIKIQLVSFLESNINDPKWAAMQTPPPSNHSRRIRKEALSLKSENRLLRVLEVLLEVEITREQIERLACFAEAQHSRSAPDILLLPALRLRSAVGQLLRSLLQHPELHLLPALLSSAVDLLCALVRLRCCCLLHSK